MKAIEAQTIVVIGPPIKKLEGMPSLLLTAPSGTSYAVVTGAGLYTHHDGDHFEADCLLDELGVWRWEWQGFTSDRSLHGAIDTRELESLAYWACKTDERVLG